MSVWPRAGCVGPVSVEQRLMHTHRRWAHVLASLCVRSAVYTRAREAMISENTAARVDQWQHADSPAGQPAIRDDEIGGTERARAERMTGWDDGGGEENGQGLRRVIMNVCCRRLSLHFRCFNPWTDLRLLRPITPSSIFCFPIVHPTFVNSVFTCVLPAPYPIPFAFYFRDRSTLRDHPRVEFLFFVLRSCNFNQFRIVTLSENKLLLTTLPSYSFFISRIPNFQIRR